MRTLLSPFGLALLACFCFFLTVQSLHNGVGQVPAMGWNSWNTFRCNINESLIREIADAIVSSGLKDAGYKYINLDDCWQEKRGADNLIIPFKQKFPSGMKALADYIHSKGLLFGVYSDTGNHTCEGYPGSWGFEKEDAETYASWGVDYLKYDYCGMEKATETPEQSYVRMRDALNATGRPILFSICNWGHGAPHKWGSRTGHSWRTGADVFATWDAKTAASLKLPNFLQPVMGAVRQQEALAEFAGPGGFNDPDMLVVGLDGMYPYGVVQECPPYITGCKPGMYISREKWGKVGGLTTTEQRSHFALWAMMAAPLILGNDPRSMTITTLEILTAPEVLAVSQDALALQARKVWSAGTTEIWVKKLSGQRIAILALNTGDNATSIKVQWERDIPDVASEWARLLPPEESGVCKDTLSQCADWAKVGECERNPVFMADNCKASCPGACPKPAMTGPQAWAAVRNLWTGEELGVHPGGFTAHLLEPHEGRLLAIRFTEPSDRARAQVGHLAADSAWQHSTMSAAQVGSHAQHVRSDAAARSNSVSTRAESDQSTRGGAADVDVAVLSAQLAEVKEKLAALQEEKKAAAGAVALGDLLGKKKKKNGKKGKKKHGKDDIYAGKSTRARFGIEGKESDFSGLDLDADEKASIEWATMMTWMIVVGIFFSISVVAAVIVHRSYYGQFRFKTSRFKA